MKVLEKDKVVARKGQARVARAVVAARPVARPAVAVRARVLPATKRRSAALAEFSSRMVVFATLVGLTYVGSTLGGYVMLERARQTARHGTERAAFARAEAREARASIEALTNPSAMSAWATAHGFVAGQATEIHGGDLVAGR